MNVFVFKFWMLFFCLNGQFLFPLPAKAESPISVSEPPLPESPLPDPEVSKLSTERNWFDVEYGIGLALPLDGDYFRLIQGRFHFPLQILGSDKNLYFEHSYLDNSESFKQLQTVSLGLRHFFHTHEMQEVGSHVRWFYTFSPLSFALANHRQFKPLLGPLSQDELGVSYFPGAGFILLPKVSVGVQLIYNNHYGAILQVQTMMVQDSLIASLMYALVFRF